MLKREANVEVESYFLGVSVNARRAVTSSQLPLPLHIEAQRGRQMFIHTEYEAEL